MTTITLIAICVCILPIVSIPYAQSISAEYSYDYDVSFLTNEPAGEDTIMTLYNSDFPPDEDFEQIQSICFLNLDLEYLDCIHEANVGAEPYLGNETNYISFFLPENFGLEIDPVGIVETILLKDDTEVAYYTPYEVENYLYNPGQWEFLIAEQESVIYGYNLTSNSLYEGEVAYGTTTDKVEATFLDDDIYLEMPETMADSTITLQLYSPYSNKIEIYVAPNLYDDPYQIYQSYLVQHDIYKAQMDYDPTNEVVVAVIDSGVDIAHPDLENSIWINEDEISGNDIDDDDNGYVDDVYGWTFRYGEDGYIVDPSVDHGTIVAGIIAAEKDNDEGVAGIAENTKIMNLDITDSYGEIIDEDTVVQAIYYAADNGADIINLSLGSSVYNTFSTTYNDAIEYAYKKGCLIVAAAGNGMNNNIDDSGENLDSIAASPICNDNGYDMVLGVASVDNFNELSTFSNYGSTCVDLTALGENVFSSVWESEGSYDYAYGTSFSAPIVAGIAAMIKGQYPDLANWQIQYLLEQSGENIDESNADYEDEIGVMVNAKNAFDNAGNISYPTEPEILANVDDNFDNDEIFSDISDSNANYDAIMYLYDTGVIRGYDDGTFKPDNAVNRAELLKILVEGNDVTPSVDEYNNCFPDVTNDWYAPYVCYAKEQGWVGGYPDGTFKPADTVNKVEALKMLINSQGMSDQLATSVSEQLFSDTDSTAWYAPYVKLAKDKNILEETGGTFTPQGEMDRAGVCENLYRIIMLELTGENIYEEGI